METLAARGGAGVSGSRRRRSLGLARAAAAVVLAGVWGGGVVPGFLSDFDETPGANGYFGGLNPANSIGIDGPVAAVPL